uniref:Uncharacterized protein n=1 Tax=Panagrolaimus sp. JU765 TaxID=591449 RepID=A0AC34Q4U7_9BILA
MDLAENVMFKVQRRQSNDKILLSSYVLSSNASKIRMKSEDDCRVVCQIVFGAGMKEFRLEGIKYTGVEELVFTGKKSVVVEVGLSTLKLTIPTLPRFFRKADLPNYSLYCQKCDHLLALPHPNYVIELEEAQEVMETAMGCCRCCGRGDMHCGHLTEPSCKKMLLDKCIPLVLDDVSFVYNFSTNIL